MTMLYLDHAASTPVCSQAQTTLIDLMSAEFANPSAAHKLGRQLAQKIDQCRKFFLSSLQADSKDQFLFNSSATESNNTIIRGIELRPGDTIFLSSADHPSITAPGQWLKSRGVIVREIPLLKGGLIDQETLFDLINAQTKMLLIGHINNHTGNLQPIMQIAKSVKEINSSIHIHIDAVQSFTKVAIDLRNGLIDSLAISGHKIGGPKGVAGLYLKAKVEMQPLLLGGGQESGMRSSTQAYPLIEAFKTAANERLKDMSQRFAQALELNRLVRRELARLPYKLQFPFSLEETAPFILTFLIPGIASDILLRHFEQRDIYLSTSSACSSKAQGASPVYSALGIPAEDHLHVLRLSFGGENTHEEMIFFVKTLRSVLDSLQFLMQQ